MEDKLLVRGREQDIPLVKDAVEAAKSKAKKVLGREAPDITVSTEDYLPAGNDSSNDEGSSWYAQHSLNCIGA